MIKTTKRKKKISKVKIIHSLSKVPKFKNEDQERKYWETHALSDELWDSLYNPKVDQEMNKIVKRLKMTDRRK